MELFCYAETLKYRGRSPKIYQSNYLKVHLRITLARG